MMSVWIILFMLILARVAAFVAALPLLGSSPVPRSVKLGLAVALTVPWFQAFGLAPDEATIRQFSDPDWITLGLAMIREIILGAALALAFGLVLAPARIAGEFLSQELGLTLGNQFDPTSGQPSGALTQIFEMLGGLIFLSLDVHHLFFAVLHETFVRWPLGGGLAALSAGTMVRNSATAQDWGLLIVAPIVLCLFLTSVVLALLAKAAPQMNFFSIGFALRLAVGLVATLFLLPDLIAGLASAISYVGQLALQLE